MFPSDLTGYQRLLHDRFGFPEFRRGQAELLTQLGKSDVLAVMPTGCGKSLGYVLPALTVGRTVVVSPLIALMQDQVESLQALGVTAAFINSNLDRAQQNENYNAFVSGRLDLLYVAPERFANDRFVEGLSRAGVNLLAVDEAHCVSEWGHDFRPDYLALDSVRQRLGFPRTLALTATAEPRVRADILQRIGITEATTVAISVDRPNLRFSVEHLSRLIDRKQWLVRFLRERKGQSGIVYGRTRAGVEELAEELRGAGVAASAYHAGMEAEDRTRVQRKFVLDEVPVIVATNAFGMGIDKPDVRFVIHFNMPGRIEAYDQESGRAGRDGDPAECVLLYGHRDAEAQQWFIDQAHPNQHQVREAWRQWVAEQGRSQGFVVTRPPDATDSDRFAMTVSALRASGLVDPAGRRVLSADPDAAIGMQTVEEHRRYAEERLRRMETYVESSTCRRATILRYFGEEAAGRCDACDNCARTASEPAPYHAEDLYDSILEAREQVARRSGREPREIFEDRTARELVLYRPQNQDELRETWGIGETKARWFGGQLLALINMWEAQHPDAPERPARKVLPAKRKAVSMQIDPDVPEDDILYQRLRAWRMDRAQRDAVPAYVIASDRTLRSIAHHQPRDRQALSEIWGLGEAKVRQLGAEMLEVVLGHAAAASIARSGGAGEKPRRSPRANPGASLARSET